MMSALGLLAALFGAFLLYSAIKGNSPIEILRGLVAPS